jgi:hypothetical protein
MKAFAPLILGFALTSTAGIATAANAIPESPAIWREVTGITNSYPGAVPVHTRPHVPAFRTSTDGRIGMRVKGAPTFALLMPEKLTQPTLVNPAGSYTMSSTNYFFLNGYSDGNSSTTNFVAPVANSVGSISHCTLYDVTAETGTNTNPRVVNNEDVYDLTVLAIYNFSKLGGVTNNGIQLFSTPVQIVVTNVKSTGALIRSITKTGPTVAGPVFLNCEGFEPMIAGDGRLLVFRIGGGTARSWSNPNTGVAMPADRYDICYSYYTGGTQADVTKWTNLIPITYAPFDNRINQKFGFAMAPFRDCEGSLIPPGEDIGGTYPWIDRQARNLFFTAVRETLHYSTVSGGVTNWNNSRYPQTGTPEESPVYLGESSGGTRGCCVVGLWTHGKVVLLDTLNNDMDYAVGLEDNPIGSQRLVNLFQTNSGPLGNESGWIRLGAGRINNRLPAGENQNGTIMDSIENIFNYKPHAVPVTLRDVVWTFSNGKQTDELAFDDYVDPDAFIVANMSGLLRFDFSATNTTAKKPMLYDSGWNATTRAFDLPVRFQNAATSPTNRWIIPKHGLLVGSGRLEPAATGGVYGKGLWLDGSIGLQFAVTNQPQNVGGRDWYIGLFVDCRIPETADQNDATERRLLTFPDGTAVFLRGRNQLQYRNNNGDIVHRVVLPLVNTNAPASQMDDLVGDRDWAHFALQVRSGGSEVDFYLDGMIYNRWRDVYTSLFQLTPGKLTIGQTSAANTNGFIGWVDDFKVFAHAVDPETACNHAAGTLIGLPSGYSGEWKTKFADRYPAWAHQAISEVLANNGEATYPAYACFHNYWADKSVRLDNIPAGTVSLRQSIHFPEGPLFNNAPRPHSAANAFCLTCHHSTADGGLDLTALTLDSSKTAPNDLRRQPMQPFRRVFGRIPAGFVPTTGLPASAQNLGPAGQIIDLWMQPAFMNSVTVQSFSLLESGTGRELMPLTNGSLLDPARLGTSNWTIRANLDSAQGSVTMKLDAGANNTKARPPYTLFGNTNNPYAAGSIGAGSHTITATPLFGSATSIAFTVVTANTVRVVADYRDDFRAYSPASGWTYEWNATGSISNRANYRYLAWSPKLNSYTANGTPYRPDTTSDFDWGRLYGQGGNPGNPASLAGGHERYAIAGYRVKKAGYYAISNSFVTDKDTAGNGGQLLVFTDTSNGTVFTKKFDSLYAAGATLGFDQNVGFLDVDDTIYVAIGPNGNDSSDWFYLDFSILYRDNSNPLP